MEVHYTIFTIYTWAETFFKYKVKEDTPIRIPKDHIPTQYQQVLSSRKDL